MSDLMFIITRPDLDGFYFNNQVFLIKRIITLEEIENFNPLKKKGIVGFFENIFSKKFVPHSNPEIRKIRALRKITYFAIIFYTRIKDINYTDDIGSQISDYCVNKILFGNRDIYDLRSLIHSYINEHPEIWSDSHPKKR